MTHYNSRERGQDPQQPDQGTHLRQHPIRGVNSFVKNLPSKKLHLPLDLHIPQWGKDRTPQRRGREGLTKRRKKGPTRKACSQARAPTTNIPPHRVQWNSLDKERRLIISNISLSDKERRKPNIGKGHGQLKREKKIWTRVYMCTQWPCPQGTFWG